MKKIQFFTIIYFMLFCFSNCSKDKVEDLKIIQIDLESAVQYSRSTLEVSNAIQLETSDSAILSRVGRMERDAGYIYLSDPMGRGKLFLFDEMGNFLKSTEKGKGKGEIEFINDFNLMDNNIIIYDEIQSKVSTFSKDLVALKEKKLAAKVNCQSFNLLPNKDVLLFRPGFDQSDEDKNYYRYGILDSSWLNVNAKILPGNVQHRYVGLELAMCMNKDYALLAVPLEMNLYQLSFADYSTKISYVLDFGDKSILDSDKKGIMDDIPTIHGMRADGKRVTLKGDLMESDKYITLSFMYFKDVYYFIYDKDSGLTINSYSDQNLPLGSIKHISDENDFTIVCNPEDYLSFVEKNNFNNAIQNLEPQGNYVLLTFRIDNPK